MLQMSPLSSGAVWVAISAVACFGVVPAVLRAAFGLGLSVALPGFAVCTIAYGVLLWIGRRRIALDAFAGLVRRRTAAEPITEEAAPAGAR